MDDADAEFLRPAGRSDLDRLAFQQDLAVIGLVDAGQDLHQRRLAGAVLAHQGVHLAGAQFQPGVVQRAHTRKGLAHACHGDEHGHRRSLRSSQLARHRLASTGKHGSRGTCS